jgi:Leucine-rich repeat (LRR) protein
LKSFCRLEQVYLHHNQIRSIPGLRNCPNLKELHLGFNRIEDLTDDDVQNVPGIKLLDLRDNKVS